MTLFTFLFALVVLLYGVAAWKSLRNHKALDPAADRKASAWLLGAFLLHGGVQVARWILEGKGPLVTLDGILWSLSISLSAALLIGRLKSPLPVLNTFFLPVVLLLAILAFGSGLGKAPELDPILMTPEMAFHIFLTFLGFAHFTLAFGVATAYWIQDGQLKQHQTGRWTYRMPPLETLDALTVFYTALGFLLWAGGLLLGVHQAVAVWEKLPMKDPKILGAFLVLVIYTLYFVLRWGLGVRGRRSMALNLIGYFLALFTFVGVRIFLTSRHAFETVAQ